jgi:hypothetical protein
MIHQRKTRIVLTHYVLWATSHPRELHCTARVSDVAGWTYTCGYLGGPKDGVQSLILPTSVGTYALLPPLTGRLLSFAPNDAHITQAIRPWRLRKLFRARPSHLMQLSEKSSRRLAHTEGDVPHRGCLCPGIAMPNSASHFLVYEYTVVQIGHSCTDLGLDTLEDSH